MNFRYAILLVLLSVYFGVFGQQNQIRGMVFDLETKLPLSNANIYIDQSIYRTTTNANGEFILENYNNGLANLVVSYIGYKTEKIQVDVNSYTNVNVHLKKNVLNIDEVIIDFFDSRGWVKYGQLFSDNFLGTSEFSKQCSILNPEVLRFRYDSLEHKLFVRALDALKIENNALGYHLLYDLDSFVYDVNSTMVSFDGAISFKEFGVLSKKILSNRKKCYSGSINKFLRSIYSRRVTQDDYVIGLLSEVRNANQLLAYEKLLHIDAIIAADYKGDTVSYLRNNDRISRKDLTQLRLKSQEPPYYKKIVKILKEDDLTIVDINKKMILKPQIDGQIIFGSKIIFIDKNYLNFSKGKNITALSTLIFKNNQSVVIDKYGQYFPRMQLLFTDYLGWFNKVGTMLPYNYLYKD